MKMKHPIIEFSKFMVILFLAGFVGIASSVACAWDSHTYALWKEKIEEPDLYKLVFEEPDEVDLKPYFEDIERLQNDPKPDDPEWLTNLSGAYLRTEQPKHAISLLEPVVDKFSDVYGIHANLGTAYHLIGDFLKAEHHIARDLEINPEAHFGLEKYHLALLQYLIQEDDYKSRHLFVDEFTVPFWAHAGNSIRFFKSKVIQSEKEYNPDESPDTLMLLKNELEASSGEDEEFIRVLTGELVRHEPGPEYRKIWKLGSDPNLLEGIVYMTSLNRDEPACWTALGAACLMDQNYFLATEAFEKAVNLNSPLSGLLRVKQQYVSDTIKRNNSAAWKLRLFYFLIAGAFLVPILYYIFQKVRKKQIKPSEV